jgi:lipopolysaccharide transport system ATP-binding protein
MGSVARHGRTVLFVSHNLATIKQLCEKCIYLNQGHLSFIGCTNDSIKKYLHDNEQVRSHSIFNENRGKDFQIRYVRAVDHEGKSSSEFNCDCPIIIDIIGQIHHTVPGLFGYLDIRKNDGTTVMESDSFDMEPNPVDVLDTGFHHISITIPPQSLGVGEYCVYINFSSNVSVNPFNEGGELCAFSIYDETSKRGNRRRGFFSTRLNWKQTKIEKDSSLLKLFNNADIKN